MPNGQKEETMKGVRFEKMKQFKPERFYDTLTPEKPATSITGPGSLVEPKGRSVHVSAPAPNEPTETIFAPDKSENYSIRDKAPQDR